MNITGPASRGEIPLVPWSTAGQSKPLCDLHGLAISEVSLPPALVLEEHAHKFAQIAIVLEGRYRETARGREVELGPGSLIVHDAAEVHANVFGDEEMHGLLIDVESKRFRRIRELIHGVSPVYVRSVLLQEIRREIEVELRHRDAASGTALEGLVLLFVSRASRLLRRSPRLEPPEWYGRAVRIIERSFRGDVRLSRVAAAIHLHPVTLAAAFRRYRGSSVGHFIAELRLNEACRELLASDRSLEEIAQSVGFYDPSHLRRAFRRRFGMSPAEFRRQGGLD